MARFLLTAAVVCLSAGAFAAEGQKPDGAQEKDPVTLKTAPEMAAVEELGVGAPCKPDAFPEQAARARADWAKKCPWVAKRLTPQLVRSLSRWAKPQMEKYQAVPPLEKADIKLIREDQKQGKLVFEATVDTLPVHAPLVTRWLKLYLLYDMPGKSITAVTITIRGERRE